MRQAVCMEEKAAKAIKLVAYVPTAMPPTQAAEETIDHSDGDEAQEAEAEEVDADADADADADVDEERAQPQPQSQSQPHHHRHQDQDQTQKRKHVRWATVTVHEFGVAHGGSAVPKRGPAIGLAASPEFSWTTAVGDVASASTPRDAHHGRVRRLSAKERVARLRRAGFAKPTVAAFTEEAAQVRGARELYYSEAMKVFRKKRKRGRAEARAARSMEPGRSGSLGNAEGHDRSETCGEYTSPGALARNSEHELNPAKAPPMPLARQRQTQTPSSIAMVADGSAVTTLTRIPQSSSCCS